ncbi:MAG TPA: rRNA maturation RNase YbeY [Burkholderiales bacterium]|nr:rRNA maturation RNase YbeY [Burkholderiales bacterium]
MTLRVVGSLESRYLNGKYRKKARPTNVLSFPYGAGSGDVVLCHPVIRQEAEQQGKPLRAHYAHLVVHGVLHLRGYDHVTKAQAERMERREIAVLRRLGIGDPYR